MPFRICFWAASCAVRFRHARPRGDARARACGAGQAWRRVRRRLGRGAAECSAQQQLVEIAAALLDDCRVLILDEPTSALSQHEVERLAGILRRFKADGVAVLYITHRFEEVFAFGDRATVFRDGQVVGERVLAETDRGQLIRMMVGRDMREVFAEAAQRHRR